jgi:RNA polymerase sigma factor FliA
MSRTERAHHEVVYPSLSPTDMKEKSVAMIKSKTLAICSTIVRTISKVRLLRAPIYSLTGVSRSQRGPPSKISASAESLKPTQLARRDALVLAHLPVAKAIGRRILATSARHADLQDLVQAGILGLIDAAHKFDPKKHVAFSIYAKYRITGAMLDSLRELDWATRDMRRQQKQVEAARRALEGALLRAPTESEVANKLGMEIGRCQKMMGNLNVGPVSVSTHANENGDFPTPDFPCSIDIHPDRICARSQLRGLLEDATNTLPVRYQQVVRFYYGSEMTMSDIGRRLAINESRVSQIHKIALQKMATVLHGYGIDSIRAF